MSNGNWFIVHTCMVSYVSQTEQR